MLSIFCEWASARTWEKAIFLLSTFHLIPPEVTELGYGIALYVHFLGGKTSGQPPHDYSYRLYFLKFS